MRNNTVRNNYGHDYKQMLNDGGCVYVNKTTWFNVDFIKRYRVQVRAVLGFGSSPKRADKQTKPK